MEPRAFDLIAEGSVAGGVPFLQPGRAVVPGKFGRPPYSRKGKPARSTAPFSVATTLGGSLAGGQFHRGRTC
jgi:hypothetical protein